MTRPFSALVAIVGATSLLLLNAGSAQGQRYAIAGQIGSTGLGGGVVLGIVPRINLRSMYGVMPVSPTAKIEGIDFTPDLPSFWLTTLDLYPVGGLHVSVGALLITRSGKIEVDGTFEGVSVDFGGQSYTGAADDHLLGTISLKDFQPYAGLGIGNALGQKISINFDAGAGFGKRPRVDLSAVGPLADAPAPAGPAFLAGVEQKEAEIEDKLTLLRFYPVFSISLSISF